MSCPAQPTIWLQSEPKRAKILDFTLGCALNPNSLVNPTGFIVGTPAYLSPEQSRGDAIDARSDLFNLGCTLYQMATALTPFKRASMSGTLKAVLDEELLPPNQHNPALPSPLNDLILQLLAKNPSNRPESAAVVANRFHSWLICRNSSE